MKISIFETPHSAAASTARISPAEVISIYGPGIGRRRGGRPRSPTASIRQRSPTCRSAINGVNIPLLYVSANQINAVAPMELSIDAAATVQVVNGTAVSAELSGLDRRLRAPRNVFAGHKSGRNHQLAIERCTAGRLHRQVLRDRLAIEVALRSPMARSQP